MSAKLSASIQTECELTKRVLYDIFYFRDVCTAKLV